MAATKTKTAIGPLTAEAGLSEAGEVVPVPVPAGKGKTVAEMTPQPKKTRKLALPAKLRKLESLAADILSLRTRETKLQLQIGRDLLAAEPLFIGDDGKPGTLPFTVKGLQGEDVISEMTFGDWSERYCKLGYSSVRQYMQAARFAGKHEAVLTKTQAILPLALLDGVENRSPEKVAPILASLPDGATIDDVKAAITKHAPKKKTAAKKKQDTSKAVTTMAGKLRDIVWPLLARLQGEQPMVAMQDYGVEVARIVADPKLGKGSAIVALALQELHAEYNRNAEAAAEKLAEAEARRAKK